MQEGFGKLIFNDKYLYIGEFKNNKMNGKGKLYKENNLLYEGDFSNDMYEGEGKLFIEEDYIYAGKFLKGKPKGEGILYGKNKEIIYKGIFDENTLSQISPNIMLNYIKNSCINALKKLFK